MLVASSQGGVVVVWDTESENVVHISDGSYCEALSVFDKKIYCLCAVSNYNTPWHFQVYSVSLNTIDINECGKKLFCQNPCKVNEEQIDSIDLDVSENGIKVVINEDNIYTFSDTTDEEINTVRKEKFAWLYDVFTEDISTHFFENNGIEKTDLNKKKVLMANIMKTVKISGITCHIIINGVDLPTIYWGGMANSAETIKKVLALCEDVKCNYVIFEVRDWNSAFSPWKFELSKKQSFSGGGRNTLEWLMNECIPHCEHEYGFSEKRIICGYSLAGLFSLWTFYESQIFSGVISCSGSLWFEDWISYAESHFSPTDSSVYLSLGNREEKTKNPVMATVRDCTHSQYELVCNDKNVSRHILEWNEGGHFNEHEKRIAKGIKWTI